MSSKQAKVLVERIGVRSLIALVLFIVLCMFYVQRQHRAIPLSSEAKDWKGVIEAVGAEVAYKQFADTYGALSSGTRHSYAHGFGAGLYAAEGAKGFPICRDLFDYGCAHGFIVRALQVEGESAVERLADACRKQPYPSMCLHGIGHGLVSYLGYDSPSFEKSVSICREVARDTTTSGCVGGATMEFGLKSMSFGALALEPVTDETRYKLCLDTKRDAKSACYFWITGWWYSSLTVNEKLSPKDAVAKAGTYCASVPEQEFAGECFAGIGDNVAMASGYSAKLAIEYCDATSVDSSERVYCKAYAENILLGDTKTAADAPFLCDSEKSPQKERCDYLARTGVAVFDKK